jgi:hypothetical protein
MEVEICPVAPVDILDEGEPTGVVRFQTAPGPETNPRPAGYKVIASLNLATTAPKSQQSSMQYPVSLVIPKDYYYSINVWCQNGTAGFSGSDSIDGLTTLQQTNVFM